VSRHEDDRDDVVEIPINGTLDLHTFTPGEMSDVVREYLRAAACAGIHEVRIVHGKGTGALRNGVHRLLDKLSLVASYRAGGVGRGEWGATIVTLRRSGESDDDS